MHELVSKRMQAAQRDAEHAGGIVLSECLSRGHVPMHAQRQVGRMRMTFQSLPGLQSLIIHNRLIPRWARVHGAVISARYQMRTLCFLPSRAEYRTRASNVSNSNS